MLIKSCPTGGGRNYESIYIEQAFGILNTATDDASLMMESLANNPKQNLNFKPHLKQIKNYK